jgi:hypothetical protein
MKRILQTIVATAVLAGTVGAVHAQNWVGLRTGYPLGVTLHYGIENAISGAIDLRVSGRIEAIGGSPRFGVGVDFLRTVSVEQPFFVYVGGGPAISVGGNAAYFEVHGLLGGEYRFTDLQLAPLGIFGELSLGAEFGTGGGGQARLPTFGAALGFNWHF